jgi:hypothetical protein
VSSFMCVQGSQPGILSIIKHELERRKKGVTMMSCKHESRRAGKKADGIDRRAFLAGAAAAGVAGMLGCRSQDAQTEQPIGAQVDGGVTAEGGFREPTFLTPPAPIPDDQITKAIDGDVVVVGAGICGLNAARGALEAGARKVIVVEKATTWQYRSGQFASVGGIVQRQLGIKVDPTSLVTQMMLECGWRSNQRLLKYWAENSGDAFDWMLEPLNGNYIIQMESEMPNPPEGGVAIAKRHWPHPEGYSQDGSPYKFFDATQIFSPDLGPVHEATYNMLVENGVTFLFSTFARQLIRPNGSGRVEGVIAQDMDDSYIRINASKGVVLAAGDYSGNPDMLKYYSPQWSHLMPLWMNMDAKGEPTNTGDGHLMGIWVGGKMELGPHGAIAHQGNAPVGADGWLQVDIYGERFMNEDVEGQALQNQISRLPKNMSWQVFDSKWPEELPKKGAGHSGVTTYLGNDPIPGWQSAEGGWTFINDEKFNERVTVKADSIEGLAALMEVPADALAATINRYNELVAKGHDDDFGKRIDRMFPITVPPYYAIRFANVPLMAVVGGLVVNTSLQVLDKDDEVIEGLYAAGNNQGGRFPVDFPLAAPGASHSTALVFGRLAGTNAATI